MGNTGNIGTLVDCEIEGLDPELRNLLEANREEVLSQLQIRSAASDDCEDVDLVRHEIERWENMKIIQEHDALIQSVANTSGDLYEIPSGTKDSVSWRQTFRAGKHQPVAGIEFTFPGGRKIEIVVRSNSARSEKSKTFPELYEQYPSVRKHFPHLYFVKDDTANEEYPRCLVYMERIFGYDFDHDEEAFQRHLESDRNLEKLCREVFSMLDEIFEDNLSIQDFVPTRGHNIIYNLKRDVFQPFDIDTVQVSDLPHHRKFMFVVENAVSGRGQLDDASLMYAMRMIQMYRDKYPGRRLYFEFDETIDRYKYVEFEGSAEDDDDLIYPEDERYEDLYQGYINWMGTEMKADGKLLPLKLVEHSRGVESREVSAEMLKAIENEDIGAMRSVIDEQGFLKKGFQVRDKIV